MLFKYNMQTRYSDTAQDGIVHHSSFVLYLEEARLAFFKAAGLDINEIEKEKMLVPVIDLSLKYLKSLRSSEDIEVQVYVSAFSKVRFTLCYQIFREDSCVAKASVTHCFLNASFKPIPIPQNFLLHLKRSHFPS